MLRLSVNLSTHRYKVLKSLNPFVLESFNHFSLPLNYEMVFNFYVSAISRLC